MNEWRSLLFTMIVHSSSNLHCEGLIYYFLKETFLCFLNIFFSWLHSLASSCPYHPTTNPLPVPPQLQSISGHLLLPPRIPTTTILLQAFQYIYPTRGLHLRPRCQSLQIITICSTNPTFNSAVVVVCASGGPCASMCPSLALGSSPVLSRCINPPIVLLAGYN